MSEFKRVGESSTRRTGKRTDENTTPHHAETGCYDDILEYSKQKKKKKRNVIFLLKISLQSMKYLLSSTLRLS